MFLTRKQLRARRLRKLAEVLATIAIVAISIAAFFAAMIWLSI